MQALELDNVTMAYGLRVLFEGLSVRVPAGKTLVVTGANGAGKSTLLKVIAGLARPERGVVRWVRGEGRSTDGGGCRHFLGYAAPDVQLYPELTGAENLAFFARLRGASPESAVGLMTTVGLSKGRGSDLLSEYSSGMRQRMKIAASLIGAPPALIWDEPTATLDGAGGTLVETILAEHGRAGGIAVIATNNADEAERWGDIRVHVGP